MNSPSSPALRPLQISCDGNTLVGRSPLARNGRKESPSIRKRNTGQTGKASRKITSYFASDKKQEENVDVKPLEKSDDEDSNFTEIKSTIKTVGINTQLILANVENDDEDEILEKLYSSGPTENYWKICADNIRQLLHAATLEKLSCDQELDELMEEKKKLEEELEEYKEYFELREYSETVDDDEKE